MADAFGQLLFALSVAAALFVGVPLFLYQCFKMAALGWCRGRKMSERMSREEDEVNDG